MKKLLPILICTIFLVALSSTSQAVETLHWQRLPLAVPLVVGQERVVFIDRNIRVGVPAGLEGRLHVQSAGGAVYLRATAPIAPTRLQLQDTDTGALILLDISAQPGDAPLEPVRIVEGKSVTPRDETSSDQEVEPGALTGARSQKENIVPVALTRYAAQSLYAPVRTIEPVNGLSRVNLRPNIKLDTLLPSLSVHAKALAAWRLQDQWVTAVRLTNTSSQWLSLDPRGLQGDFIAATFQHPDLGPAGSPQDTTIVYLVTRGHGLAESLLPVIHSVDASLNLPSPSPSHKEEAHDAK